MTASRTTEMTAARIEHFAEATGDNNSIHLDEAFAATTRFGKRIAHGLLTAGLISAVLANDLPGPGTIYMGQTLQFKAPVYIGDVITASVELIAYRETRRIATFKTLCVNQDGVTVLEGEATVLAPE
ncbi:MAG: MaoC family dehydratase [Anaerolineae bacterium]|nr:MaoC family dehydratase [Anaerolineae bacterium]